MNLGVRLKQRLEQLGMSQKDLAKLIGTSQVAVQKIISGSTKNPGLILEIANAVKSDPRWLKFGEYTQENNTTTPFVAEPPPQYQNLNKEAALEALTFINKHFTAEIREEMGEEWVIERFIKLYNASEQDQLKNTDAQLILGLIK